ncbi:DUF2391 family protein [Candidatus Woesearchaeota archaeon]|nr:DUF2391 family protein [Candidatus Woesearchaeota archaeon]
MARKRGAKQRSRNASERKLLSEEKKVEAELKEVEKQEAALGRKESEIELEERKIENQNEKIERIEEQIKHEVTEKPLRKFSFKDVNKGIVGAFIGVVAHFAFVYSKEIAKEISITKATIIIVFSYLLIVILMYETGYREIREKRMLGILPTRATIMFGTSLLVVLLIFFLFNQINLNDPVGLYKQLAVTSVLASLGAGTADLIGRH